MENHSIFAKKIVEFSTITVRFKELDMASCSGYSGDIIKPIWSSNKALILS